MFRIKYAELQGVIIPVIFSKNDISTSCRWQTNKYGAVVEQGWQGDSEEVRKKKIAQKHFVRHKYHLDRTGIEIALSR